MPQIARFRTLRVLGLGICVASAPIATLHADDTAKIKTRTGRRPVKLWPLPEGKDTRPPGTVIDLGGWRYHAIKAATPKGGVPWELIVTPSNESDEGWRKGDPRQVLPKPVVAAVRSVADKKQSPDSIPVIKIPQIVWKQRMDADLQDVVGIHFHEYVSDDYARILYTLHKVPPDNPDGSPPAAYKGKRGTRIEATLLAPVKWSLDQSIVVRVDPLEKHLTESRAEHEKGHADVSQDVLVAVPQGPRDWNLKYCTGRRSRIEYYWRRELIGRSWDGYQKGVGKLLTLRTSIVLVPPTRWSMLVPLPPERITQKHIQQFNDAITLLGPQYNAVDSEAQRRFHAHHGEYEDAGMR